MNGFCTAEIKPDASLRPAHGVMRSEAMAVTADARAASGRIIAQARREAAAIVEAGREQAEAARREAQEAARALTRDAERETLRRGAELLDALERANGELFKGAQATVVDLAQALFDRLVGDMTPRKRIEAALRRLRQELPRKLISPALYIHPDDAALLPEMEWEVCHDASMARGSCRLEANSGEWRVDFDAAVEALREAFASSTTGSLQRE